MNLDVARLGRFGWPIRGVLRAEVVLGQVTESDPVQDCPICDKRGGELVGRLWLHTLAGSVDPDDDPGIAVCVHTACARWTPS
jgi:hypothetical protein